jgi:hypothetical protein
VLRLSEGLGVRAATPSFDLGCEFLNSCTLKETLSLGRVVATACSKLAEEAHCVDDAEFSHKGVSRSLRDLRDRGKVCSHCGISETRPRREIGVTFRFGRAFARRSSLSSAVTK